MSPICKELVGVLLIELVNDIYSATPYAAVSIPFESP